jgi:hypothetical protein
MQSWISYKLFTRSLNLGMPLQARHSLIAGERRELFQTLTFLPPYVPPMGKLKMNN